MSRLSWNAVSEAACRATPVHRPPGRGRRDSSIRWDLVSVRPAEHRDASKISIWLKDDAEFQWLGEDPAGEREAAVQRWLEEAKVALLLLEDSAPIAFANVAMLQSPSDSAELGRLIVHPNKRKQGVGSTLLQHLGVSIVNTANRKRADSPTLFARVAPENVAGHKLLKALPFSKEHDAQGFPDALHYDWFRYKPRAHSRNFGESLRRIRELHHLTQAQLAFLCGIRRPTINMVESGRRLPSIELLQRFQEILAESEFERAVLLFAAVSEPRPKNLREFQPLSPSQQQTRDYNLWIFTDRLAEFQDKAYMANTREALEGGSHRWYFLPRGEVVDEGRPLFNFLRREVPSAFNDDRRLVRIYEAPQAMCRLRLVVHNPQDPSRVFADIEGEDGQRMRLSEPAVEGFVRAIRSEMQKQELNLPDDSIFRRVDLDWGTKDGSDRRPAGAAG